MPIKDPGGYRCGFNPSYLEDAIALGFEKVYKGKYNHKVYFEGDGFRSAVMGHRMSKEFK